MQLSIIWNRFISSCFICFLSSIPSQYVSPLSSEDGGIHPYQHEGEVVIIVPPLNTSLDDDQDEGSPKTTESTSKYILIISNFIHSNIHLSYRWILFRGTCYFNVWGQIWRQHFRLKCRYPFSLCHSVEKSSLQSLRMFESRVPKRIFGSKGGEVTGSWGKLHSMELHNLYTPPNIYK